MSFMVVNKVFFCIAVLSEILEDPEKKLRHKKNLLQANKGKYTTKVRCRMPKQRITFSLKRKISQEILNYKSKLREIVKTQENAN